LNWRVGLVGDDNLWRQRSFAQGGLFIIRESACSKQGKESRMLSSYYVSLSSQLALDKRMSTIATNVANSSTIGYRASGVTFETTLSKVGPTPTAYASSGKDFISTAQGPLTKTDNPFDVAVQGEGWLAIRTPNGVAYTRDGRLKMMETGELRTMEGYPVLDAGNAPITLDPTLGPPMIFRDGMVNQGDIQVGALGLFSIDREAALTRGPNSSVIPSLPATPILDFSVNGITQGFIEGANINPMAELTKLITTSRSFESVNSVYDTLDSAQKDAIRTLGGA
jgi:flagellar basal-body rod protein FlgF